MKKYLNNDEMAKYFGGYDFRTSDMRNVCKAQRELTLNEIKPNRTLKSIVIAKVNEEEK